jgi:hypothetical protein
MFVLEPTRAIHYGCPQSIMAGGLLRLQRVYGGRALGNDWAAGTPSEPEGAATAEPALSQSTAAFKRMMLTSTTSRRLGQQQQPEQDDMQTSSGSSSSGSCKGAKTSNDGNKAAAAFGQLQYNVHNLDDYQFV